MAYIFSRIPLLEAASKLPDMCRIVQIDAESIDSVGSKQGRMVPEAAVSFGFTLWHKRADHMWCERGDTGLPRMWHYTIKPTAPANPLTMDAFWSKHPEALAYATANPQSAKDVGRHLWAFLAGLQRYCQPVVLMAQPWLFDGAILDYLLDQYGQPVRGTLHVAEIKPLLCEMRGWTPSKAKTEWDKALTRHGPLPHMADKDTYIQGQAFADLVGHR